MHGVWENLLDQQSKSIGLPLKKILLSEMPSMSEYNTQMRTMLEEFKADGITQSIFGDIFLEDLKRYRDNKLAEVGMEGVYPLWKMDTKKIMHQLINLGFKSIVVNINTKCLDHTFLGRELDYQFINDLLENVDVCGENGEYHTFVYDGPIFSSPIPFDKGEIVFKNYSQEKDQELDHDTGFGYLDLVDKK
jgi:uncharacterized protein (TIGR00290 family)